MSAGVDPAPGLAPEAVQPFRHEIDRWHLHSIGAVTACGLGNVISITTVINGTVSAFLTPVCRALHLPRAQFSFGLTIISIVGLACYPLSGRLMDRLGRRPVALAGNLLFGASIIGLAAMQSQPLLRYLLFALVGATATLPSTVLFGRVTSSWFVQRRGLALGLSGGMAFGVGGMILPGLAQHLIDTVGWRSAYVWLGVLVMVVGFPAFWLFLREAPAQSAASLVMESLDVSVSPNAALRQPAFWLLFVGVALGAGSISAIITHMTPIATGLGLPIAVGAWALSALFFANAIWQVGIGLMLDGGPTPRRAAPFVLAAVAGTLLLAVAHSSSLAVGGALLVGFGCGTEYGLLPYCISRYFGLRYYGEIYGWIFGAIMLVQGVAPFMMDVIYSVTGTYTLSMVIIALTLAACALLIIRLPPYGIVSPDHPGRVIGR